MRAASYVGRVGGLAVALGVGSAIFTGAGVAHATEGEDSGTGGTPAGQEQDSGGTTTAVNDTNSGGPGTIDLKLPRLSDIIGRHRADDTTPDSNTATSIVERLSDAAKRLTDAIENAADADNTVVRSTTNTGGSSLQDRIAERQERLSAQTSPVDTLSAVGTPQTNNAVSNQFVNHAAVVKDWIESPRALAGRSVDPTPTVPAPTPLWTPQQILAPLGTMKATPGTGATAVRTTSLLTTVLGVVNPFAGNSPGSPVSVDPLSLVVAGAARREIGVESFTPTALLAPTTDSLTYDPDIDFVHGVITGENGDPTGLTYLVVSQPTGGGKVYVDPTTGDFAYLPDLSSVQNPGQAQTFSVVVAETTPFTSAITGVPLIGGLASQILVVLYQVPVLNEVLSPIIGKSEITDVSIKVADYADPGDPIAFTVMVPSDDGVMISTNYFPAWSVADGTATVAPTILNGPGLATAGNINPSATTTVSGLVPGIDALTEAGYNVVTWDPRGEFDSTGTLELDSPEFEGQDVKNIITWLTDNPQYTHPAMESANDPWIGMVGGSYGGGIQLVSAAIDDRVDVIVPGIAWNSLKDSLYTSDAFKTSYASLLLLGLVTTGSRINPEIYGGIITGAVLGILTPSQQQLLERSGPWDIVGGITVPVMFVQGTVDVLFPLQQALNNAEGIPPSAQAAIRMIWFCGGHGACLTMTPAQLQQQQVFLTNNTIAFLNNALPEADGNPNDVVTIPKFQFVDQNGTWYQAAYLPIDDENPSVTDFYSGSTPVVTQGSGGLLAIIPLLGGSGPQSAAGFPASLGLGSQATNAVNVPLNDATNGTQVVGSPQLTMTYSGIGTSRHVYAQVVDKKTGLVVGNIVTPLPVTLDGQTHTQTYSMEDIVWTYGDSVPNASDLELQIVGSATPYLNLTEFGYIDVKDVTVSLPTPGPGANVQKETLPPLSA